MKEIAKSEMLVDPYGVYRENLARMFEEPKKDGVYLHSSFTVKDGKCYHIFEEINGREKKEICRNVFTYDEEFINGMLEPSITDYCQRSKLDDLKVIRNSETLSSVQTSSKNRNRLSINNINPAYANKIAEVIRSMEPVVYDEMVREGNFVPMRAKAGNTNILLISFLIGFFCGLIGWISLLIFK